jgi:glutamyl-tRNA reductase
MADTDIVISSTGAPHAIVTREQMHKIMRARREKPIFLIDIAVPRDIEPEVADIDNVYLYNIDDLQTLVLQSIEERKREIEGVKAIVEDEVHKFMTWTRSLEAVPVIRLLREQLDAIREGEWERNKGRLSELSDRDRQIVQAMLQAVVNKIVHQPIVRIKDYAASPNGYEKLDVVRELFGLEIEDQNGASSPAPAPEREAPASTCHLTFSDSALLPTL